MEAGLTRLHLTVATPGGRNLTIKVDADQESLRQTGVTKEEMEASLVQADARGRVGTGGQCGWCWWAGNI